MGQDYSGASGLMLIIGIPILLVVLFVLFGGYELVKHLF